MASFDNSDQTGRTPTRAGAGAEQPEFEQDARGGASVRDNQAEWVVLGLLGVVGCLGLVVTASDGWRVLRNDDAYLPPEAAILAAALFGIGYWAASRIGGVKPVLPTIPLLILASFPLLAPAERLSEVTRWKVEMQQWLPKAKDALASLEGGLKQATARVEAAHNRLDKVVIYTSSEDEKLPRYDSWLASQKGNRENSYAFSAKNDEAFCFLTGVQLRQVKGMGGIVYSRFDIVADENGIKNARAFDNEKSNEPAIKGKVVCVGLPTE